MKKSPVLDMASCLSRISRLPQYLGQIRQPVLAVSARPQALPWRHYLGRAIHENAAPRHPGKDPEAIRKAVEIVAQYPGRMPPVEKREVLSHLTPSDRRTARKKIKQALQERREASMADNRQRQKEAGGAELEPLETSLGRKHQVGKKKKKAREGFDWPVVDADVVPSPPPTAPRWSVVSRDMDDFLPRLDLAPRSASAKPDRVGDFQRSTGASELNRTASHPFRGTQGPLDKTPKMPREKPSRPHPEGSSICPQNRRQHREDRRIKAGY